MNKHMGKGMGKRRGLAMVIVLAVLCGAVTVEAGEPSSTVQANGTYSPGTQSGGHYNDLFGAIWIGIAKSNDANKKFETVNGVMNVYFAQLLNLWSDPLNEDKRPLDAILEGNVRVSNENEYSDRQKLVFGAQNAAFDISLYFPAGGAEQYILSKQGGTSPLDANLRDYTSGPSITFGKAFFANPSANSNLTSASFGAVSVRFQHDIGTYFEAGAANVDAGNGNMWGTRLVAHVLLDAGSYAGLFLGGESIFGTGRPDEVSVYMGVTIKPEILAAIVPLPKQERK